MKPLLLFLVSLSVFAQFQTPVTVLPGAGSATGEIRLQERRTNGLNYTGIRAPQSLAGDVVYDLPPADGVLGQALVTNGAGALSWSSVAGNSVPACASTTGTDAYACTVSGFTAYSTSYCIVLTVDTANTLTATIDISSVGVKSILRYGGSALVTNDILANAPVLICYDGTDFQLPPSASPGSGSFLDGGNTFGAAATLGTNDTYNLIFERGGVPLVELSDSVFNIAPAGVANFATRVTKLDIGDISGVGGIWDIQATGSFLSSSSWKLRDNGGGRAAQIDRAILGTRLNNIGMFGNLIPRRRQISDGDDVDDSTMPDLGSASAEWGKAYITDLRADTMGRTLFPTPTNTYAIGGTSNRLSNLYSVLGNFSGAVNTGTLTVTTPTVSFHEAITVMNTAGTQYAAPAIFWRHTTGTGAGTHMADLILDAATITAGAEDGDMVFRTAIDGTVTEMLRLAGSNGYAKFPDGHVSVGPATEPDVNVRVSEYDLAYLGKVFTVEGWQLGTTDPSDSGTGKFSMWRKGGAGADVRALEVHTTCEAGGGFCWGMELRIGTRTSPPGPGTTPSALPNTIENIGVYVESKLADWVPPAQVNCDGGATLGNGCKNNIGVAVLGRDGWWWPYAYLDEAANVDWFVDDVGRTSTRAVRFLDLGGISGYSLYWEAEAVATTTDSYWRLKDNGGTTIVKIDREVSNTAVNYSYWLPDIIPWTNLGSSLGSATNYFLNVYGLNFTTGTILPTTTGTYSIGSTGNRYAYLYLTGGLRTAGDSFWSSGSTITMQSGSTLTLQFGTPGAGKVLTSDAGGVATWEPAAGTAAPFTLTQDLASIDTSAAHLMMRGSTNTAELVAMGYNTTGNHGFIQTVDTGPTYTPLSLQPLGGTVVVGNDLDYESTGAALHINKPLALLAISGYDALAPNMQFRSARGSAGSPTATQSGDRIGQFAFFGYGSSTRGNPSAAIAAFAEDTYTDSSKPAYIAFSTTATSESNRTERWRISGAGNLLAIADNTYDIGASGATRPRNLYIGSTLTVGTTSSFGGNVNLSGSLNTMSGTLQPGFDGLGSIGSASYSYGSLYAYTGRFLGVLTLNSTITGDLLPTTTNTYISGSSTNYWNQMASNTVYVEGGSVRPRSSGGGTSGISTAPWSKTWTQDISFTGTLTPPSGIALNGTTTCSAGQAVKSITFSQGIATAITCAIP